MKKRFSITIAMISVALLMCSTMAISAEDVKKELRESSTIEKIIRSGKMRVGMSTFVPWAMQDKNGKWIGFEIDVATQLAKDMGVKVEFVPTKWEGLIPSLLTGKFDLIIAGMTGTPQRALKINFTEPYDFSEMHMVAHKEVAAGFKTVADFNKPEVTILCRNGTTAVPAAKRVLPNAQLRLFSENGPMVQELLNGKAHAIVASAPEPAQHSIKYADTLFFIDESMANEPISIGVPKGDPDTIAYLNNWIIVTRNKGFFQEKVSYWWKSMDWQSLIE
ncbi:MAG: transporter substrate-binding domain-containing protein [Deltaproteobacteria bacterium]|jgi:polar amino acid transport system substrate-binding protein|nr:transporter substrate-binding domain-containing protein [Deltaproteobacteria bacterium]MBW2480437.1 transporter substrate-binding domain-containing protein [Deltaproteobacteria bacterium]